MRRERPAVWKMREDVSGFFKRVCRVRFGFRETVIPSPKRIEVMKAKTGFSARFGMNMVGGYSGSVLPMPFSIANSTIFLAVGMSSRDMPMFTAATFSSGELLPGALPAKTVQISGRLAGP